MEITREELENLIAEALMRDGTFRPKRRNWNETMSEDERRARISRRDRHLPLWMRPALGEAAGTAAAQHTGRVKRNLSPFLTEGMAELNTALAENNRLVFKPKAA